MDTNNDTSLTLDRIIRERLEPFEIPLEIRNELRKEILAFFGKPERKPFGACTMTIGASVAADKERKEKRSDPNAEKPRIV